MILFLGVYLVRYILFCLNLFFLFSVVQGISSVGLSGARIQATGMLQQTRSPLNSQNNFVVRCKDGLSLLYHNPREFFVFKEAKMYGSSMKNHAKTVWQEGPSRKEWKNLKQTNKVFFRTTTGKIFLTYQVVTKSLLGYGLYTWYTSEDKQSDEEKESKDIQALESQKRFEMLSDQLFLLDFL